MISFSYFYKIYIFFDKFPNRKYSTIFRLNGHRYQIQKKFLSIPSGAHVPFYPILTFSDLKWIEQKIFRFYIQLEIEKLYTQSIIWINKVTVLLSRNHVHGFPNLDLTFRVLESMLGFEFVKTFCSYSATKCVLFQLSLCKHIEYWFIIFITMNIFGAKELYTFPQFYFMKCPKLLFLWLLTFLQVLVLFSSSNITKVFILSNKQ